MVRRGCKGSFEPRNRKASCTGAAWGCTGAKQGCTWCKRLLGDLCGVGPKDILHPLLSTFASVIGLTCPQNICQSVIIWDAMVISVWVDSRRLSWPLGSTGVDRYRCISRSAATNLGKIPPNPLFYRVFLGREHFGTCPCLSPSHLGRRLYFARPHFPPPELYCRTPKHDSGVNRPKSKSYRPAGRPPESEPKCPEKMPDPSTENPAQSFLESA